MHDTDTTTSLDGLRIYEDDDLVFDGDDHRAYTVCESAADIAAALTTARGEAQR